MLTFILKVILIVCSCSTVSVVGTPVQNGNGYSTLNYNAQIESIVFDQERINSTVSFTLQPVAIENGNEDLFKLQLNHVSHSIASYKDKVTFPQETLQNEMFFTTSPTGIVNRVYYYHDDDEDLVHMKKYIASVLSGHLQDNTNDAWSYSTEEIDHAGKAQHHYQAKVTKEGKFYSRQKKINPAIPHVHYKEYTLDQDRVLTRVLSHEHLILNGSNNDPEDVPKRKSTQFVNKISCKLQRRSQLKEPILVTEKQLGKMANDTIELNLEYDDNGTLSLKEGLLAVKEGIICTHKHKRVSSERAECVVGMRKVLEKLLNEDLQVVGDLYLKHKCDNSDSIKTRVCQHDRDLMIDLLARLGTQTAQAIIIKNVLRGNHELEIQRSLFHFTQLEQPLTESVETVAKLCFGRNMKDLGNLQIVRNQQRACMTFGALLKHHIDIDEKRTNELLDHLHTWLKPDHKTDFDSQQLQDIRNTAENEQRLKSVHVKSVLLHALGNAANPKSLNYIAEYAKPNTGHDNIRHTAMQALRHYTCEESATLLLNVSINDMKPNIRSVAHSTYIQHPKAGKLTFTDENILISKNNTVEPLLRRKRSGICDLIEELTLDYRLEFPGFDWQKKVGNEWIGADFGVKMVNYAHLHLSPVTMFFELNIDNRAWINSHVKLFKRHDFLIFNAQVCFQRSYRMYNLSTMVDFNVVDIITEFELFDEYYDEIVEPIIDSVNEFYDLLQEWKENLTEINLGLGLREAKQAIDEVKENITRRMDEMKGNTIDWVNDTFGGLVEFVKDVKEFKAAVINKKEDIVDTGKEFKQNVIDKIQYYYEETLHILQMAIDELTDALGMEIDLQLIDECIGSLNIFDIFRDPEQAGEDIVACLNEKITDAKAESGLMEMINTLLRSLRRLQNIFQSIVNKIQKLKLIVQGMNAGGWKVMVEKILDRHQGFIDVQSTGIISDDTSMNLQYSVKSIEEATKFIEKATRLIKDAPTAAMTDITRGVAKIRAALILFDKLNQRFKEMGSELQGKLAPWLEPGVEQANLVRDLKDLIKFLNVAKNDGNVKEKFRNSASAREKLEYVLKERNAIDEVVPLLEYLVTDIHNVRYVSDNYTSALSKVAVGMKEATKSFEKLKRRTERSKAMIQKIFGTKFHIAFPKQVKTECDDACGGCGIYPNIMRGRRGAQLLAESGEQIVTPFDVLAVPVDGSSDEIMLYPLEADLNDYEIIIAFINPVQKIYDYPNGFFADAGVVIGQALSSPCQPNFIHIAVRKLNSTVQSDQKQFKELLSIDSYDDRCGVQDMGEYIPCGEFVNSPDPGPMYVEGCSKVEFRHIFNYFDIELLAETFENFELDYEQAAEDIGDKIQKGEDSLPEYPPDIDDDEVHEITKVVEDSCSNFTYELQYIASKPLKSVQYSFDEDGIWQRKISFNLPEEIPKMSDYFNTMNFTVKGFGDFLLKAGLQHHYETLIDIVNVLAIEIDMQICEALDKLKPPKLRTEVWKEKGFVNGSKDVLITQLQQFKLRGCEWITKSLVSAQQHFCEVQEESDCHVVDCITQNRFDNKILEIPVGVGFDSCNVSVHIAVAFKYFDIQLHVNSLKTTIEAPVLTEDNINVTAIINVKFHPLKRYVAVDISLKGCDILMSICYGDTPIFENLIFPFSDGSQSTKRCKRKVNFLCQKEILQLKMDSVENIMQQKMNDFLYSLDRFNISRKEINLMTETARTAVSQELYKKTALKSSIQQKEIFTPPDIRADDDMHKGPFDIPFFKVSFRFPPICITVTAGGVVNMGLTFNIKLLSANASILPQPSVGSYAEADGRASIIVSAVGLKLRGTLLETFFNLLVEIRWSQYPIHVDNTLRVDLIPLGVDFKGYFKILFVEVEFMIFTWRADLMEGEPHYRSDKVHDITAPMFEWKDNKCRVEQVVGRHWSDPAFFIEAPFYDPQSLLHVHYAIGTYQDGTDVLDWSDMEGVSMIAPMKLKINSVPLHFTVRATNTDNQTTIARAYLDTYDVTPPSGRFEVPHMYTSIPNKIGGFLIVIEDSMLLEENHAGLGVARGQMGDQVIHWHLFNLSHDAINKEAKGDLDHFAAGRAGKLTSIPIIATNKPYVENCAKLCTDAGNGCASFDYEYMTGACDLHWTIEGKEADLVPKGAYHNFEKLGAGYTASFYFDELNLIHGEAYYFNARITNVRGFEGYITSHEVIADYTTPEPGPIGEYIRDEMRHDNCSAAITHAQRCIEVTPIDNHRFIIDGIGAATVFNGNLPKYDTLYTIANNYLTANWDGFRDNETDIWGYTWAAGRNACRDDVQEWDDPHSHLADKSYWTHQGLSSGLSLADGPYYVTVQALNGIEFGGALVTTVCHSTPMIVDTSPPWVDFVDEVLYDEDFDIMGVYYKASDPESGIRHTDIGLGETKHDVFVRPYSRHDPLQEGFEMVSVDSVDLPVGIPVWVRIRVVNNVEMMAADNAKQALMMDPTPPVTGSVLDGDTHPVDMEYQSYDFMICVQWYGWYDPESGIDRVLWAIGSSPNNTDVMEFVEYDHHITSACVDINVNHSMTYYNTIRAYNKAINSRASQQTSNGITVDITEPNAGWVNDGKDRFKDIEYSSNAASVYTHWGDNFDPESDIKQYVVTVSVNGEDREQYTVSQKDECLEDHAQHFEHTDFVQVTVEAENGALLKNKSHSSGYRVDLTPPDVVFVRDHPQGLKFQVSNTEMYAHWLFEDTESNIEEYRMRIIEHKGPTTSHMWPEDTKYRIYTPKHDRDNEFTETIDLELENGMRYSVEVNALNKAGMGFRQISPGVTVDITPPIISRVYIGSFGANEDLNEENQVKHDDRYGIQASWIGYDHESGVQKFMVAVGVSEGDTSVTNGFRDFGTSTNGYIDDIYLNVTAESGSLYYVSVYTVNGAGQVYTSSIITNYQLQPTATGVHSDVLPSRPIHVYGENVAGVVYDGRDIHVDKDYSMDTFTFAVSFQGFDSPLCNICAYEWSLGSEPGYSDILPYSSYGIVMIEESHYIAEIHIPLKHTDVVYASVRAHTGHSCSEAILHSCSDGIVIDTVPPEIEIITLGDFSNDTLDEIIKSPALYQHDYSSIAFEWNTTDLVSGTTNDTWMAGSLPLSDDKHEATTTTESQIPIGAIQMIAGETIHFSIAVTDMAGNTKDIVSPPLTVDLTEPIVDGFMCTQFMSTVQSEVQCSWISSLDHESPIEEQHIAIGERQLEDQIVTYSKIPKYQYKWKHSLHDSYNKLASLDFIIITLKVTNKAKVEASVFSTITIDKTPPIVGETYVTTPAIVGEEEHVKVCQQSLTTMQVTWDPFIDRESGINSYEVGIGTGPHITDVAEFRNVGNVTNVFMEGLVLIQGLQMFASVNAINNAGLISQSTTAGVYISPNPHIKVWDGLEDKNIDFQNDLSVISGQVFMSDYCPIHAAKWTAYDILGNPVTNETDFFNNHFANDELQLKNLYTYYVVVEMVDAINRTFFGKSNGVMISIQPPKPAEVRDGPYFGEDRNYQESTTVLSINWDQFGDPDDPLQIVEKYEVAIGDNPAYPETRSNIHYFEDAGLSLNHTFSNLRLTPKRVKYFATVTAYSKSGAYSESISNGIWVGYSPGMEVGEVYIANYSSNNTYISFYWDKFESDFKITHYRWGIGLSSYEDVNVTLPCEELLPDINKWASVQHLVDEKRDLFAEKFDLSLEHNSEYFVVTVAEDEVGQCIAAPSETFTVDLTPPNKGKILVEGIGKNVQYTTSKFVLKVSWVNYTDDESSIKDFYIQLKNENNCSESTPEDWEPVSVEIDVKGALMHTFMGLNLQYDVPYRIIMTVTNGAGLTLHDTSDAIFVDTTATVEGVVKDGLDWTNTKHYQSSTSTLEAIFAISPLGTTLNCPLTESLLPPDNVTWTILNDYVIECNKGNFLKEVYIDYQNRNVEVLDDNSTNIMFHYNISSLNLEGGALVSEQHEIQEGEYTLNLQGPNAQKTIFSITLSDGWMDEYTDFEMPVVQDQLTDEEFLKVAKGRKIDFDRNLDLSTPSPFSSEQSEATTFETTTEPTRNLTEPNYTFKDDFDTNALGLHFLGFPFGNRTNVWMVMLWCRDTEGIKSQWAYLDNDPALFMTTYRIILEKDLTEAVAQWNIYFTVNNTKKAELNGVNMPQNYTVKMRHWTHDNYVPELQDPFNPLFTNTIIQDFTIPLPKERPCQIGKAFFDMESQVQRIYVGVGNSTDSGDNVVPFHLSHQLCHPCGLPCDFYKCSDDCKPLLDDGYQMLTVSLVNLTLDPGDFETEEQILDEFDTDEVWDINEYSNETAYISNRYHMLIKVVNGAGLETTTYSPGVKIDITPPVLVRIEATDPDYDPVIPTAYQWSNNSLSAWWVFEDRESPIVEYRVAAGTAPDVTDIAPYVSVGIATTVVLVLNHILEEGKTYYVTVEAVNAANLSVFASTSGVTIHREVPDVSNGTSKPLYSDIWLPGTDPDESDDYVYITELQNQIGLIFEGYLEDNVYQLVWETGEYIDDNFITSRVEVDKREYNWNTLQIRDNGFFYFGGEKSEIYLTWLAQKSGQVNMTMEGEYIDPGRLWLEPGRCVHHKLYAQNVAHLRSLISHTPVCIVRQDDHVVSTKGTFSLEYNINETKVILSGEGTKGALISTEADWIVYETEYITSANISFVSFVENPHTTMHKTSRIMHNRLKEFTGYGILIAPAPEIILLQPLEITFSYSGVTWDPFNETIAIIYWDTVGQKWVDVEESSLKESEISPETEQITGWFSGPVEEPLRNRRHSMDYIHLTEPQLFALFVVKPGTQNSPPELVNKILLMKANDVLEKQLLYTNSDDDPVRFELTSGPKHGQSNLTEDGMLSYRPDKYYFGWDEVNITMIETKVPPGTDPYLVEERLQIKVREIPFAPWIFLQLTLGLNKTDNRWMFFTDDIEVQYEANTTQKSLGTMYVCDLNQFDILNLTWINADNDNVTVLVQEFNSTEDLSDVNIDWDCLDKNLKRFDIKLQTSLNYYGYDKVQFIGYDNYTLYSQAIKVNVYTLFSPCGNHGTCTSSHDPFCMSNERANSFDSYTCNCEFFYKRAFCDDMKIPLIVFFLLLIPATMVLFVVLIMFIMRAHFTIPARMLVLRPMNPNMHNAAEENDEEEHLF